MSDNPALMSMTVREERLGLDARNSITAPRGSRVLGVRRLRAEESDGWLRTEPVRLVIATPTAKSGHRLPEQPMWTVTAHLGWWPSQIDADAQIFTALVTQTGEVLVGKRYEHHPPPADQRRKDERMTTPDPIEYLLARYAEDEDVARAASPGPWRVHEDEDDAVVMVNPRSIDTNDYVAQTSYDALHIARHDPARVLADIKAKRAVVDIHCATDMLWGEHVELGCPQCGDPFEGWLWTHPCPTLRALLQPYADRPDFPDEWRAT